MKTPLSLTLSLFLSLGSVSGVVNQMRPPVQSDFGGGGLQSPIYVNGVTGECFVYVNGTITPINTPNVMAFGAKGDFVTDDTAAIQAAVNAGARGAVFFPPGRYRITSAINIKTATYIWSNPLSVTIYLSTQNQNGFVIGDGTSATAPNVASTMIVGLQIAAPPIGVAPSASGAFIVCQKANNFVIKNCSLYGFNNTPAKTGWNGIFVDRCLEWVIDGCTMNGFVNNGIRCVGAASSAADFVVDGRIDRCEVTNTAGDAMYFGDYTAAITITDPIIYQNSGWGIKIDCTAASGVGFNYMILRPDIEATTTSSALGAVYFKQAAGGEVLGGWFGGTAGAQVDATASSVRFTGVLNQGTVPYVLSGSACSIVGCDTAGDGATTTTGIQINAGATDTNIVGGRVRQFTTAGINFTGAPARCEVVGVNYRSNTADLTNPPADLNSNAFPKGSTTPAPVSGSGTLTSATAAVNWTKPSNRAEIDLVVSITTNGTGASDIRVPLPFTPTAVTGLSGVVVETGKALCGYFNVDGKAYIFLYDGTYPGADARTLRIAGAYRV